MAGLTARFSRCVVPKFAFINRTSCLTTPVLVNRFNRNHDLKKRFSASVPKTVKDTVTVYFVDRDGDKIETVAEVGSSLLVTISFKVRDGNIMKTKAKVGDNLLDVIIENDVDIDGFGACEGTLACSTCHLIFKQADYDKLPEKATDEELDMLDLAYGLQETSRLGCQIIVTKDMEGLEVHVPAEVADARGPS